MENQGITQWDNGNTTTTVSRQVPFAGELHRQAAALREQLGDSPSTALQGVLNLLTGEAVVEMGDNMAQLNMAVCHYALQARQELIGVQHELFLSRQRTVAATDKAESMAQLVDQTRREKAQLKAELEAYRAHLDEIEALLNEEL
jgi:hypothetical protein